MNKSFANLSRTILLVNKNINEVLTSNIHTSSANNSVLNIKNMNRNVTNLQYAVRGPIVLRAGQIEDELRKGVEKPFDTVIRANIGDCHATGQKPNTFIRRVMALCTYPELFKDPSIPEDAKDRARRILADCKGGSVGSYSESEGLRVIRQDIAKFIEQRDEGIPSEWQNVHLTTGASDAIKSIMEILLTNENEKPAGFMIPIPQYPFYTATIAEFNAKQIGYYLDEDNQWGLNPNELQRAYDASLEHCSPRAIIVINPGNPTGQVLSKENIQDVIRFAQKNKLFIMADEVYQDNIYLDGVKFHSFKKVATQMGPPYSDVEIASFYSTSKGFMGECGVRGGYLEVFNMDPEVKANLDKLASIRLCSSTLGQACMAAIVNPPKPNEPSYESFMKEKNQVLNGLKEKANLVTKLLNNVEGVKCNTVQGAMYAFPKINIPRRAIEHAKNLKMEADVFYGFQLLEQTGICIVPGSGFHQLPGTYHFRTTILPPVEEIKTLLSKFEKFHINFLKQWSD